jgi:hypothetical protein
VARRERARWRLSAVLLSLLLAFGAAMGHVAGADQPGPGDTHRSPSAVKVADTVAAAQTPGERPGQPRLLANRGHGGALLFVIALSALLAASLRPRVWSLTASLLWLLPAAAGVRASLGRAPPPRLA